MKQHKISSIFHHILSQKAFAAFMLG